MLQDKAAKVMDSKSFSISYNLVNLMAMPFFNNIYANVDSTSLSFGKVYIVTVTRDEARLSILVSWGFNADGTKNVTYYLEKNFQSFWLDFMDSIKMDISNYINNTSDDAAEIDFEEIGSRMISEEHRGPSHQPLSQAIKNNVRFLVYKDIDEKSKTLEIYDVLSNFLGFISWSSDAKSLGLILENIFIMPKYRLQGIGKRIINKLAEVLNLSYIRAVVVQDALRFYERLGWKFDAISRQDYHMHYVDAKKESKPIHPGSMGGFELVVEEKYYHLDLDSDYNLNTPMALNVTDPNRWGIDILHAGQSIILPDYNNNKKLKHFFEGHNLGFGAENRCVLSVFKESARKMLRQGPSRTGSSGDLRPVQQQLQECKSREATQSSSRAVSSADLLGSVRRRSNESGSSSGRSDRDNATSQHPPIKRCKHR